jgi:hypothetical protein
MILFSQVGIQIAYAIPGRNGSLLNRLTHIRFEQNGMPSRFPCTSLEESMSGYFRGRYFYPGTGGSSLLASNLPHPEARFRLCHFEMWHDLPGGIP